MSTSHPSLRSELSFVPPRGRSPGAPPPVSPAAAAADVPRFLSREACRAVIEQMRAFGIEGGNLRSRWRGDVRWARNRITTASDWRDNHLSTIQNDQNQIDTASLRAMARELGASPGSGGVWAPVVGDFPQTSIWSETTYAQAPAERSTIAAQLVAVAEQAGMLSAGYLCIEARGTAYAHTGNMFLYAPQTIAQYSVTVRDPQGTGSGWAGVSSYDWGRIDAPKLAAIAVDKCLKSRSPVKLEPGRYTTILEPQAAYELLRVVLKSDPSASPPIRLWNESESDHIFSERKHFLYPVGRYGGYEGFFKTKIGEQVFDPRLSIRSDPMDPQLGTLPFSFVGDPYVPVTWVDHGVLTTLAYGRGYAQQTLHEPAGKPWSGAFRVEGSEPPVSIEEMIATTKRGLWVTRFWDVRIVDDLSCLCTGLTRDGIWLIENGQVSHPIQNFRFTESPLFAFNNVEQIGTPVPVFNPEIPAVMPAVKVRDFSFTSLVDAV